MFRRWIPLFAFCSLVLAAGAFAEGAQSQTQSLAAGSADSNSLRVMASAGKEQVRFASLGIIQRMRLEVLNAGTNTTSGGSNSFFGMDAGRENTTGYYNSFFGRAAGVSNTTATNNSFFGIDAGFSNTIGYNNTFVGAFSGRSNVDSDSNSFFGYNAGRANTASWNSFFGETAGNANTTACCGAFFGRAAGASNLTGASNSFFGNNSGQLNTAGGSNSFFGRLSGYNNLTGNYNSFFGSGAGDSNVSGNNNTYIGASADGTSGLTNATAIGYRAQATQNNSLVLGGINGVNGATAHTSVGVGTTAPTSVLSLVRDADFNPSLLHNSTALLNVQNGLTDLAFTLDQNAPYAASIQHKHSSFDGYSYPIALNPLGGKVGIGTASPAAKLSVVGGDVLVDTEQYYKSGLYVSFGSAADYAAYDSYWGHKFKIMGNEKVRIDINGNVGIGTASPTERLQVVGNLKVSGAILYGAGEEPVPDYVFEPNYKLMPVEELEQFLAKEKHLPNIPSASEIKGKGLNLSEFQMKLLEKVEELTLYTVQQTKTIKGQQASLDSKNSEIATLKSQNAALDARLAALEQMMERLAKQEK